MTSQGSSCGACKFLRRKCIHDCIFAPYFCYDEGVAHFAAIHKIFGASNVSKLLSHLPVHCRSEASMTISYEAQARVRDPIYGCVSHIFALQQQVANLQEEIELLATQVGNPGAEVAGCGNSRTTTNGIGDFYLSSQQADLMDFLSSSNQNIPLSVNKDDAFTHDSNLEMTPFNREDIDNLECRLFNESANDLNSQGKLYLDVDPEILPTEPWLDHTFYY